MDEEEHLNIKLEVDKEPIRELITDIVRGRRQLYLPQFQRSFVWGPDDAEKLLESIIRNLPIGSIILWKPSGNIKGDPFAIPLMDNFEASEVGESYYVLDGQQRLTCLLLLYNGWRISRDGEKIKFNYPISYIPAGKKILKQSIKQGIDLSKLFKAYLEGNLEMELKDYLSYKRKVEDMIRRIVNYEVPIYMIKTYREDGKVLKEMAEAFIRINKSGMRIGTIELMLSLLAGTVSGEFSKEIKRMHKSLEGYGLDLNVLIRFVLSNLDGTIKQTVFSNVEQFRSKVENIGFKVDVIERSETAINLMMQLLESELGLSSCRPIPSQIALIPVATYLYERGVRSIGELSKDDAKRIANWFIAINMKGYYSASTNSKLQKDLDIIRKGAMLGFPYRELLNNVGERYKIRKSDIERGNDINVLKKEGMPYMFLLYVLLVKEGAEDLDGRLLSSRPYSELEKHHIFPKDILEDEGISPDDPDEKEAFISSLGNVTFVSVTANREILSKPPEEYLPECETLQKHLMPDDRELWKLDKYEEFKQKRVGLINDVAKKHFAEIFE